MKIKGCDYEELSFIVMNSPVFPLLNKYREQGLSDKRYRWDCLWYSSGKLRTEWFDRVYQYANDTHIDSALRKITKTEKV